jgi:hypothetical protein
MTTSPFAVDVTLPKDLADALREQPTAMPRQVRSTMTTLLVGGMAVASTAITFLQGPPAVAYWVTAVRTWFQRRGEGVGELRVRGPNGSAVFTVTEDTDITALAEALHRAMFPQREPSPEDDDIAL